MGEKHDGDATGDGLDDLPLSTAPLLRELFGRVVDRDYMLALFRRELPPSSRSPILVTSCDIKARYHRDFVRDERLHVVYTVGVEAGDEPRHEFILLGVAPVPPGYLDTRIQERCRSLLGHPWVLPFRRLTWYVEEARLALLLFPLDPALPALADITGRDGARLLEPYFSAGPGGERVEEFTCGLRRYNPLERAVVRVQARYTGDRAPERAVFLKIFADDHGEGSYRDLVDLHCATRGANALHVPEPLGYDPRRRMLVMSEAPGERNLNEWIKCIEKEEPLPSGVDLARLERCIQTAARSLGELQHAESRPETKRTFQDELAQLGKDRELLPGLRSSQPELVARGEALLQRLEALSPSEERLVPAHGSFRHKQMLGDESNLAVIDWDAFCLASPALDPATFLGRLRREPLLHPGRVPQLEHMATDFRRSFLAQQPGLARHLSLYEGLVLTEQMLRSFRRPGDGAETADRMHRLAMGAEEMLDRAAGEG